MLQLLCIYLCDCNIIKVMLYNVVKMPTPTQQQPPLPNLLKLELSSYFYFIFLCAQHYKRSCSKI